MLQNRRILCIVHCKLATLYSVLGEYSVRYSAEYFGRNGFRSDTSKLQTANFPFSATNFWQVHFPSNVTWLTRHRQTCSLLPSLQAYVTWFAVSNFFVPFAVLLFCYRCETLKGEGHPKRKRDPYYLRRSRAGQWMAKWHSEGGKLSQRSNLIHVKRRG